jgi:hypothetical protein
MHIKDRGMYLYCRLLIVVVYIKQLNRSLIIIVQSGCTEGESKEKTWCMGLYAGVDYNLTLCSLQRRLHIYHEQPYARVYLVERL